MKTLFAASYVILAQSSMNDAVDRALEFMAHLMLAFGAVVIFYGGWKISRGETADGLACILGGFIIAVSVPLIRYLASLGGAPL